MLLKPYPKTDDKGIPSEIYTLEELQILSDQILNITMAITGRKSSSTFHVIL